MPDPFNWSPDQWESVINKLGPSVLIPGWIVVVVLLLLLIPSTYGWVKRSFSEPPQRGASTNAIAAPVINSGQISQVAFEKPKQQAARDAIITQTIDNSKNVAVFILEKDGFKAKRFDREYEAPGVPKVDVEVWVLWRDVSWRFGGITFNEGRLNEFLGQSTYQAALKNADAIACVGLASSWGSSTGQDDVSNKPRESQAEIEDLTDARAFKLCKMLSEHARDAGVKPTFIGMGLGFHTELAKTREVDLQQRSLVLLHIKTANRERLSTSQIQNVLQEVIADKSLQEFRGSQYSRVYFGRPICYSQTFHGKFVAEMRSCK